MVSIKWKLMWVWEKFEDVTVEQKHEVPYIGHLLTPYGLSPDPYKVKAIFEMPTPVRLLLTNSRCKDRSEWSHIWGNFSQTCLMWQNYWDGFWLETCNGTGTMRRKLKLTKWSSWSQENLSLGTWQLQRSNLAEKNYAQIEKESLFIVHGCTRFDRCVYRKEIIIQTDHKTLENIFKKPLYYFKHPSDYSECCFNYRGTTWNKCTSQGADTLSRVYLPNQPSSEKSNCDVFTEGQEDHLIESIA